MKNSNSLKNSNSNSLPLVGDLVLVLFYNVGMRRLFFIGSCSLIKPTPLGVKVVLLRRRDRSRLAFFLNSPSILGFSVLRSR